MRHVSKQAAVKEIVYLLVGTVNANTFTIIGYGNWSGGSQSVISRKYAGPHQLIKQEIGKRWNARIKSIDEYKTSQTHSLSWEKLVNMKAKTTVRKTKDGKKIVMQNQRVHKVLHCKTSEGKKIDSSLKTTVNRDLNASENILMLLRMEIKGYERPEPFRRAGYKMQKTNHGTEAVDVSHATEVANIEQAVILSLPVDVVTGTTQMAD